MPAAPAATRTVPRPLTGAAENGAALRDAIARHLRDGEWRPGFRLPTERALAEQYGISRTTVRRVLKRFKERRLIRQVVGSGTYVCEALPALPLDPALPATALGTSPAELMQARLAIEPALTQMVVHTATPADLARMDACCVQAETATSLADFEHWDGRLHETIAEAAHNRLVQTLFQLMNEARSQGEWGALKERSVTPERRLAYQREHRAIVAALRQRDAAAAHAAAHEHLLHVRRNLLGY